MAKMPMYTMVAGGALEQDAEYNVKCNCGGDAPIKPKSVKGYGFSKKGGVVKIVDKFETICTECDTPIVAMVLEGDPGYLLTQNGGIESLFLPQGSASTPVSELSHKDREDIIDHMKVQIAIAQKKAKKKSTKKKRR
jgi:hypothetical protein